MMKVKFSLWAFLLFSEFIFTHCQSTTTAAVKTINEEGFEKVEYVDSSTNSNDNERELVLWQELKTEVQTLKKSRQQDAKILARLQQDNRNLKTTLLRLETRQQKSGDSKNATYNVVAAQKFNDKIFVKMSRDLENLKANLNYWLITPNVTNVSRRRRNDDDDRLFHDVEDLKQEITAIKLLEDEQLPTMMANLTEHGKTLDRLLTVTESLEAKLSNNNGESVELITIDHFNTQIEFDKIDVKISQLGSFTHNLQERVFELSDKYKWYSFLVEHFNTELHIVKNELYKMMNLFYGESSSGNERIAQKFVPINEFNETTEEQSGDDAEPFINISDETKKSKGNLRTELNQMSMKINDAFSGVHQLLSRMNSLENQQTNFERRMGKMSDEKSNSSAVEHCLNRVGQVETELSKVNHQLTSLKSKLIDVNTLITGDVLDLRKEINGCTLKCERARKLAEVVKEQQSDHFTAIQQTKQSLNEMETGSKIITAKLATLQSDFLNATLTTYKDVNKELKQDLQLGKLEAELDRIEKKYSETQDSLKNVFSTLRQKADRSDFKRISDDVEKTNEKMQAVATLNEALSTITDSLVKLESQLPQDCSMQTVPARAAAYRNGVYLIKPDKSTATVTVQCDMEADGGYWTIIQQRSDGKESFNRTWSAYASGFGDPKYDYWLGNKILNTLTENGNFQLKIDVWDIFDDHYFALYDSFSISSPNQHYAISVKGFTGNLTDSLSYHNGMKFSSIDKDLDVSSTNCAKFYECGWWFSHCHMANLNGNFDIGMIWFNNRTQDWMQFKRTVMKIRPKSV